MHEDEADTEAVQERDIPEQPVDIGARADLAGDHDDDSAAMVGVNIGRGATQRGNEGLAVHRLRAVSHESDSKACSGVGRHHRR